MLWSGCRSGSDKVRRVLALLYDGQRQYAKAEPLYQRALAIREKARGPEHPDMATCLENYAVLLRNMGRAEEAAPLDDRARAIRAKSAWLEVPVSNLGNNRPRFLCAPHWMNVECFVQLDHWISKCENFSSFVFSQKYGLIAVVARTSPLPGPRLSPVKIRTKLSLKISPSSLKGLANKGTQSPQDFCQQSGRKGFSAIPELPKRDLF
jgi:tetratricopeptide (TPR) repeat protein